MGVSRLMLLLAVAMSMSAASHAENIPLNDEAQDRDVSPALQIAPRQVRRPPEDRPPEDRPPEGRPPEERNGRESGSRESRDSQAQDPRVQDGSPRNTTDRQQAREYRTLDGTGNNSADPLQGAAVTPLLRLLAPDYGDALSTLAGQHRPSARVISNLVFTQSNEESDEKPNTRGATDFLWQWGQFLDHDMDLTDGVDPAEPAPIDIPVDDLHFYPGTTMRFNRSVYDTTVAADQPRQQLNEITAWIDASNVYGVDEVRLAALRETGSAGLKTSAGDLLPFNTEGLTNAGGDGDNLFLAGDVRANEQAGLLAMHTLFVREHNRQVERLRGRHPDWSDDQLFEEARRRVAALMQVVTYREFLPALLGPGALPPYNGYSPDVTAGIRNVFSAAAYRFGHSALSPTLMRLNADGSEFDGGHLALRDAFFNPALLAESGSLEALLRGLATQVCGRVDTYVIDDVRNFLFGAPPSAGFDLVSLNIQRGRDHGLPSYNEARRQLGLVPAASFSDFSSSQEVVDRLATAYLSVEDVDLWVGGLAEDHHGDSHLGETFTRILVMQFTALRDGDRFWYQREFSGEALRRLENTRLSDIIRRNTEINRELQDNVFKAVVSDQPR